MTNEQLRMQMLSGIITEGEYKLRLNEDLDSLKKKLQDEIIIILYNHVDDINNARGIADEDLEPVADDIVDYIMTGLLDIAGSQK
jgi:hypothetical protein